MDRDVSSVGVRVCLKVYNVSTGLCVFEFGGFVCMCVNVNVGIISQMDPTMPLMITFSSLSRIVFHCIFLVPARQALQNAM